MLVDHVIEESERFIPQLRYKERLLAHVQVGPNGSFCGQGSDPFGPGTQNFPWDQSNDPVQAGSSSLPLATNNPSSRKLLVNEGFLPYERICCVHIKKPKASKNVHWLYFKPYPWVIQFLSKPHERDCEWRDHQLALTV
jgi:hypothetical protein